MRTKERTNKKKRNSKKRSIVRKTEASLDEVLVAAERAMAALDNEKAIEMYSKAASLLRMGRSSSSDTRERQLIRVLEKMGESKVAVCDQMGAKQDFLEALKLLEQEETKNITYHETRSSLFFYLGQLCMEKEALQAYQQGLASLESCFYMAQQSNSDQRLVHEIGQKLSRAYCNVAELYLTDLCYEENAENECELYLERALQIEDNDGEPLIDSLQTMASLRLSQQSRRHEGVDYILRAFDKMKVGCKALASLVGVIDHDENSISTGDEAVELQEVDAANNLPGFEFRCQSAKLLLECAALLQGNDGYLNDQNSKAQQCVIAAIAVLGSLLSQNDEVIEVWYLTGCAFASKRPLVSESAIFYLQRAMEMLKAVRKALENEARFIDEVENDGIAEELEENQIQIDDVQAKLDEVQGSTTDMVE